MVLNIEERSMDYEERAQNAENKIERLRVALAIARKQIVTLGGEPTNSEYADKIQVSVLRVLDEALAK